MQELREKVAFIGACLVRDSILADAVTENDKSIQQFLARVITLGKRLQELADKERGCGGEK